MAAEPSCNARVPLRCRLGFHRWTQQSDGWEHTYTCERCGRSPKPCTNCGKEHDPNAITVCVVTRRSAKW